MNPFEKDSKFKSLGIHKIEQPTLDTIKNIFKEKESSLHKYQVLVTIFFGIMMVLNNILTSKLFLFIFLPSVIVLPALIFYFYTQKVTYQIDEKTIIKKLDLYNDWKKSEDK